MYGGAPNDATGGLGSGGAARGGSTSTTGGSTAAGAGGFGGLGVECTSPDDCPTPANRCVYSTCVRGFCGLAPVVAGSFALRDDPPDCFDTVCDGQSGVHKIVDQHDVPTSEVACVAESCDAQGNVVTENVARGAACSGAAGQKLCDGAGNCVACLSSGDCQGGGVCSAGACVVSASCSDGRLDGDETDVDCGGSCPACADMKDCRVDADCRSLACNAIAPHRCMTSHCTDNHLDSDETDIDCGGSCAPCGDLFRCKQDTDCQSGKCDTSVRNVCLPPSCLDGVKDQSETDVDCGGGICARCDLGKTCTSELDCLSSACDLITLVCVADHCADHAFDGNETDVDCGGPNACTRCPLGDRCRVGTDCAAGLVCSGYLQKVCTTP